MSSSYLPQIRGALLILGLLASFLLFILLFGYTIVFADAVDVNGDPVTRLYVKEGGTGDGSSWEEAAGDLSQLMANTYPSLHSKYEIWVAKGTYYPGYGFSADVRDRVFPLKNFMSIYGGFAGNENPGTTAEEVRQVLEQRDLEQYETILSGDLGIPNDPSDNAYHLFKLEGVSGQKIVDGFTITKGHANVAEMIVYDTVSPIPGVIVIEVDGNSHTNTGGAMHITNSDLILRNVVFADNHAGVHVTESSKENNEYVSHYAYGGAIYSIGSDIEMENVIFRNNRVSVTVAEDADISTHEVEAAGGAIYQAGGKLTLNNVLIENNEVFAENAAVQDDSIIIIMNEAVAQGGGIRVTGDAEIMLRDVQILNNRVEAKGNRGQNVYATSTYLTKGSNAHAAGGGLYFQTDLIDLGGHISAHNVEISGNQVVARGGQGGSVFYNINADTGIGGEAQARGGGALLANISGPGELANWLVADNEVVAIGGTGGDAFLDPGWRIASRGGNGTGSGGGLEMRNASHVRVVNMTLAHNSLSVIPGEGSTTENSFPRYTGNRTAISAGLHVEQSDLPLHNSIIWGNRILEEAEHANVLQQNIGTSTGFSETKVHVAHSIVQGSTNATGDWIGDASRVYDLGHNLNQNPLFVDADHADYRLQSDSPALEQGDTSFYRGEHASGIDLSFLTTDLAGTDRISGWEVDMGAYEYAFAHTPGPAAFRVEEIATDEASLRWQTVAGALYYELYRYMGAGVPLSATDGDWDLVEQINAHENAYRLTGLQQGETTSSLCA